MHRKYFAYAGILILVMWGCQRSPSSPVPEDSLVINMILKADTLFQKAMVTRLQGDKDFGEIFSNDDFVFLNGIRLYNIPKNATLVDKHEFNYNQDYNYYHPHFYVTAGDTCSLMVITANQDTISGTTVVPDHVSFTFGLPPLKPAASETNTAVVPVLRWDNSENAYMYMVNIYKRGIGAEKIPVSTGNIVFNHKYRLSSDEFNPLVQYYFELIQFDKNYYEYIIRNKDTAGLRGARGVIGSMTTETFYYIPPKD